VVKDRHPFPFSSSAAAWTAMEAGGAAVSLSGKSITRAAARVALAVRGPVRGWGGGNAGEERKEERGMRGSSFKEYGAEKECLTFKQGQGMKSDLTTLPHVGHPPLPPPPPHGLYPGVQYRTKQ